MTVALPPPPTSESPGQTRILTGEAVHLDIRVAGIGSRALARLFDLFIQAILGVFLAYALMLAILAIASAGLAELDPALLTVYILVLILSVFVGYPVVMETLTRGRTLGKMLVGLRVVRNDGGPVTVRHTLTRSLVALAIEFPGLILPPLTWLGAIWAMIGNPQSKRLGDHVAGTIVIHESTPAAWGWVPAMPPSLAMWAATLDLAGLDDDLAFAIRSFLARNRRLREPARSLLGERLVRELGAVTNPPPPPGTPAWMYLAAVHAERHRRAMHHLASIRSRAALVWPDLATVVAPPPPSALGRRGVPVPAPAAPPAAPGAPPHMPAVRPAQPNSALPQ